MRRSRILPPHSPRLTITIADYAVTTFRDRTLWHKASDMIVPVLGVVMIRCWRAVYLFSRGMNPFSPIGAAILCVSVLAAFAKWPGEDRRPQQPVAATAPRTPLKAIAPCPECGQSLRIPADKGKLVVHCTKCSYAWGWEPIDADQRNREAAKRLRRSPCPYCKGNAFSVFRQGTLAFVSCLQCSSTMAECPYCRKMLGVPTERSRIAVVCSKCRDSWEFPLLRTAPTRCSRCKSTKVSVYLDSIPKFVECVECFETWDLSEEYDVSHRDGKEDADSDRFWR